MRNTLDKLFHGREGNIFILGLFLIFSLLTFIIISYQIDTNFTNKVTGIVFTNLFVGRVPALSFGYAANLPHFIVIGTNVLIEFILVTMIYPLFILSFNGILKVKVLENFFNEVKAKKHQHQEQFDKYGAFGLFIFVFIPFWMTGPIVGAIVGFLIGIEHYTIIIVVFIATTIAITLWGLFLQEIIDFLMVFDSQLVWILLFIVVAGLLILRFKKPLIRFFKNLLNRDQS